MAKIRSFVVAILLTVAAGGHALSLMAKAQPHAPAVILADDGGKSRPTGG